ncbi:MAG TPA: undecaprenyldiphospho-muramoylpentapeptide beta-N-acetylglucosaminyltransferase [Phycisphaerales bacterium]|nr:undecaprenyldiphospho-muramoylpentapeptide beta-N-acetylglucosaminyltransferase [Phycisphaerales bacterium]
MVEEFSNSNSRTDRILTAQLHKRRIAITGGGTGGHLYPGLAVADVFRQMECELLYLGSARGLEAEVVPKEGYPFLAVPSRGIAGSPFKKLLAVGQLALGTLKALMRLSAWKPDLVVGTGGFVCVPAVVSAAVLGVPVVLLEQNAVPGKAIKVLSRFSKAVCLSFADSKKYFPGRRTEWTGNPLRSSIQLKSKQEAREILGLHPDRPTLLVAGASQGAKSINKALVDALEVWKDKEWNIVHLTGRNHLARVQARVESVLPNDSALCYRSFGFRKDMENLYSAADLVVSRAGATTIAELTCLGLPAIFVPYPFAGGHQKENARVVVDSGGARHIPDELVGENLRAEVETLLADNSLLKEMSKRSREAARPDASEHVVNVCCEVMK